MYIETVPNRNSRPAILLREAWREGHKIRKRTLSNLSDWPSERVEALRRLLRGERLAPAAEQMQILRSIPHGHVQALLRMMRRLGLETLIASKRSRLRDLIMALIAERLLHPCSKLASTRHWNDTTLAAELSIADAQVDEVYEALDWLLARQARIEDKLAARHLVHGALVLYDVSSSSYEGRTCVLACYGHDRDGKKGLPIIVYGVLTDRQGCPISVQVYPGNTADPTTVPDQVHKLRQRFGLARVVLVGDRGMLTQARIEALRDQPGLGWLSALRSPAIRELTEQGYIQLSLFDRQNLAEIKSPDFPGERLVACFNPQLAEERARKREALLMATEQRLAAVAATAARRTRQPMTAAQIGAKVGRVINRFKVAKHFEWSVTEGRLTWGRREESIRQEAQLDGIYVIRTSEAAGSLPAADAVRGYKSLSQVERAFRCLKGIDVRVRPIFHRAADRVRAHIFLCLLAYYVEWHLRRAWAELLFEDQELPQARAQRDPVAPAQPSSSVRQKKNTRQTAQGLPVHSWETLLKHMAGRARHTCRLGEAPSAVVFDQLTELTALQARALELIETYPVRGTSLAT
jgi:transposase